MIDVQSQPQPETDAQGSDVPEEIAPIAYPPGLSADWLIRKTQHLNNAFKTWADKDLLNVEDNYKLIELKPVPGTLPNGTTVPVTTSIYETMTSRVVSSLAPRETFVNAIALDPELKLEGDVDKQEMITDFTNESIGTTKDFADKLDETVRLLFAENLTFLEVEWTIEGKEEERPIRGDDPMIPPDMPQPIIGIEPYNYELGRPGFKPLSWRMCAWDPRCKTKVSDSAFFRKREMVSINGLFELQEAGVIENVDAIVKKSNKAMTPENSSDPDAKLSQAVEAKQLPAVGWDDGVWEMDCWRGKLAWRDEAGVYQTGHFEFWVVGGDTVVKFRENILKPQRIPVITVKLSRKQGGGLMAQGPIDSIKQLQKSLNTNMSNLEQLTKNAAYSPTFYEPSSGLDGRRVSLQSNSLIPVLNVKGIQRFEPAIQAIGAIENLINFYIMQMREATAANDQAQGIDQEGGNGTATEAQILAQGSNNRFGYITEMINSQIFVELANEYLMLWKQFGQPGQMVVKDGSNDGKGYEVQPEDLNGCYIFKSVPAQSQQAKLQHATQLKSLLADALSFEQAYPMKMVGPNGQRKEVKALDFTTNQILPLLGVQSRGLFGDAQMMPADPMAAMAGMGGGPAPVVEPEPVAQPVKEAPLTPLEATA